MATLRYRLCRDIFRHVPSTKVREVAAMLKAIHTGEDLPAAGCPRDREAARLTTAIELVETAIEETLAYYARNTGSAFAPVKPILREIGRRTHVSSACSWTGNPSSILLPPGRALCRHRLVEQSYLNIELLRN